MARTTAILKYIPLMIGYFSLCVPAALCLYWLTSNTFTGATTIGIKKYYEANPPVIEWDLEALMSRDGGAAGGSTLGNSMFTIDMPKDMEEALADARVNARPPRTSRRFSLLAEEAPVLSVEAVLATE